jgi:hypothetical protein
MSPLSLFITKDFCNGNSFQKNITLPAPGEFIQHLYMRMVSKLIPLVAAPGKWKDDFSFLPSLQLLTEK